jgi:hypothetical protein
MLDHGSHSPTGRHVAPLRHIILIPSQLLNSEYIAEKQQILILSDWGFETTTSHARDGMLTITPPMRFSPCAMVYGV